MGEQGWWGSRGGRVRCRGWWGSLGGGLGVVVQGIGVLGGVKKPVVVPSIPRLLTVLGKQTYKCRSSSFDDTLLSQYSYLQLTHNGQRCFLIVDYILTGYNFDCYLNGLQMQCLDRSRSLLWQPIVKASFFGYYILFGRLTVNAS